jgi:predicted AAA+ superfamily ATPase
MKSIDRHAAIAEVARLLRQSPVVALLGARQVGKTTLARRIAAKWPAPVTTFDLEDSADLARLADPMLALRACRGLVVIDEVQRHPGLFQTLRVLADRRPLPARFLVLGSATTELLQQSAESLAGRVAFHELGPLSLGEVGAGHMDRRWRRGGFPRSYLAATERSSVDWRRDFVRTFLERDIPQLGLRLPAVTLRRFWGMLAHLHAQIFHASEIGRAFGVADTTVRRYLETLEATFVVRTLRPYHANIGKRQVKAPKVYVTDSGLLHHLLDIPTQHTLEGHPKVGASWEGFLIETVAAHLRARREQCFFWATHGGAELDLLVTNGRQRRGFEFKRTSAPRVTPSMRAALSDLKLDSLDVVHAGTETFPLAKRIRAVAASRLLRDIPT